MFAKKSRYSFGKGVPKKTLKSPLFTLRYQKNNLGEKTFAVVVSKKVDKKAVARNRIKRIFIEELQEQKNKIKSSYDLVFFLKKEALDKQDLIGQEIENVIKKIE